MSETRSHSLPRFPVFVVSRLMGLIPYNQITGVSTKNRRFLAMTAIIAVVTTGQLIAKFASYWLSTFDPQDTLWLIRRTLDTLICLINVTYLLVWYKLHPDKMPTILSTLIINGNYLEPCKYSRINDFLAIFTYGGIFAMTLISIVYRMDTAFSEVSIFFNCTLVLEFMSILEIIRAQFEKLNSTTKKSENLEDSVKAHVTLIEITADLNDRYRVMLLTFTMQSLFSTTSQTYELFLAIARGVALRPGRVIYMFGATATNFALLWFMCYICTDVNYQSEHFATVLSKAMRSRYFPCFNNKLRLYLANRPSVEISACGFFSITNSILTSLMATGTTYFIVLIQMN